MDTHVSENTPTTTKIYLFTAVHRVEAFIVLGLHFLASRSFEGTGGGAQGGSNNE